MHDFHGTVRVLYMSQIYDMGPTALLPLRRKACWGFFSPLKIRRLHTGLNPRTWVLKASTLPLDHRSRLARVRPSKLQTCGQFVSCEMEVVLNEFIYCPMWDIFQHYRGGFEENHRNHVFWISYLRWDVIALLYGQSFQAFLEQSFNLNGRLFITRLSQFLIQ
jgi:hypothetical protein